MGITEDLRGELELALAAAAEAAAILKNRSGADQIREKGRADLVTAVDEESERVIEARIKEAFPSDLFVAEEFSSSLAGAGRRWIVDPVDGTVNYVHGHPFSCVSIAFADEHGPAVGVINAPFLNEVYHAVRGGGAYLNDAEIRVSTVEDLTASLIATGFPFRKGKGNPGVYFDLVEELVMSTHGVRRAGAAALDLAYVAVGRVDAFFEIGLSSWDVAAGILLVQEAGGQVSGWPNDEEGPLGSGRVLASNGRIHAQLQEVARRYVPPL